MLRVALSSIILWICFYYCWCHTSPNPASSTSKPKPLVNPHATLECHRREYTFKATRSDLSGKQCWEYITVMSCWGRCDSGEIADWRFPYKRSYHPVCIHGKQKVRRIRLKHCDAEAPPDLMFYEYSEALTCVCQFCQTSSASCEGVPAIGTRAP